MSRGEVYEAELPFSFETFRLKGFIPTAHVDLNGDGLPDFVSSGGGDAIEIHVGGGEKPFATRSCRQEFSTDGVIRFGDLDGDDLPDFVIFDPYNFDVSIRMGRNRGTLPGAGDAQRVERTDPASEEYEKMSTSVPVPR